MNFNSVPVIDIAPFIHGGGVEKRAVADQVRRACEEIGFFSISGHGVSEELAVEAIRLGAASRILALQSIGPALEQYARGA